MSRGSLAWKGAGLENPAGSCRGTADPHEGWAVLMNPTEEGGHAPSRDIKELDGGHATTVDPM